MTEHLPECAVAVALPGTFTSCICDALRACEERAIAAAVQRVEAQIRFWFDVAPDGRLHIHPSDVGEYLFRAAVIIAIKGDQE